MMVEIIIQNISNNSISHKFTRNCKNIQAICSISRPKVTIIQLSSWSSIDKKPRTPLIQCHGNYKLSRKPKNICSQKLTPQNELFLSIFVRKASPKISESYTPQHFERSISRIFHNLSLKRIRKSSEILSSYALLTPSKCLTDPLIEPNQR